MMTKLLPNERLDDLQIRGYEIIQSPGRFCFGMDAVLLSAFANVKKHEKALDLGTGDGENLSAGQEVLRCPQIGEQSGQGRPQGAADHPDGGRHHRHLCEQFPTDAP